MIAISIGKEEKLFFFQIFNRMPRNSEGLEQKTTIRINKKFSSGDIQKLIAFFSLAILSQKWK